MATADQIDVVLTVRDAAYLARLKQDETAFLGTMKNMETASTRAGAAISVLGNKGVSDINKAAVATKGLANNTGNLAAQFNDIGVQLAGGQSPFLIALQQGTQINQVLGQAGAGGAVKALGSAFLSLLNPVSLSTIAIIALAGYAVQYFTSILTDGASSSEVIKDQNDLIRKVAENWGEAVPALQAYIDQLDRAKNNADALAAGEALAGREFDSLRQQLPDLRAELAAARIDIQNIGGEAKEIDTLQAAFDAFSKKVEDGTATSDDLNNILAVLARTTGAETIPSLVSLQGVLAAVSGALATAAANAATFRNEVANLNAKNSHLEFQAGAGFIEEQERLNSLTSDQLALENEIARVKSEADRAGSKVSDQEATRLATERLSAEQRRADIIKANNAATKGGVSAAKDADREREAVVKLIEALEYEQSLLGVSEEQKAVMNALRRAGAAATDEERAKIEELVTANFEYQASLDANKKIMEDVQGVASDLFTGFISDIRKGVDASEALGSVFDKLADKLINIAAQGLVEAAFGGLFGGGGGIGGFLSGLFGGGKRGFASGTANTGGNRGEPAGVVHGQEAVIPLPSGGKVPVVVRNGAGGDNGGMQIEVVPSEYFDVRVRKISGDVSTQTTAAGISAYDSNLGSRMTEKNLREGR